MLYIIIKAIHIIFMVSYFAGIFYLIRLLVYYKDTDDFQSNKQQILREQYIFMARRLWNIITVPAFVLMLGSGLTMIFLNPSLLKMPWFHIKLGFLMVLFVYHWWSWQKVLHIKKLQGEELPIANIKLRQANEIATFLLFLIVFTVILKSLVVEYSGQLIGGFLVLVVAIMLTVKLVNKNKKSTQKN